ncbi:MAG: helix-turn-helix domain-containing protein [Hyphomicrobiaceae bacterium]|nr:helix-turn-helix domain-containing protein [Hyphomicrobiaceae bacterium]
MITTPSARLKQLRVQHKFSTATDAARFHGWHETTYRSHENGNRGIPVEAARRYAKAYGVHPNELLGLAGVPGSPVTSALNEVSVGVWRDRNIDERKKNIILDMPFIGAESDVQRIVRVTDESADKIIGMGEFAIISPSDTIENGRHYLIERQRGDLVEMSIRTAIAQGDGFKLVAPSSHRRYVDDVRYPSKTPGEVVTVLGRVTGRYAEIS